MSLEQARKLIADGDIEGGLALAESHASSTSSLFEKESAMMFVALALETLTKDYVRLEKARRVLCDLADTLYPKESLEWASARLSHADALLLLGRFRESAKGYLESLEVYLVVDAGFVPGIKRQAEVLVRESDDELCGCLLLRCEMCS